MPTYDYECRSCGRLFESFHRSSEKPIVKCAACHSSDTRKVPSLFHVGRGAMFTGRGESDRANFRRDAMQDLRENYGVENIQPVALRTFEAAYADVKRTGSYVKDKMQQTAAVNEARRAAKSREWREGALRRTPARAREMAIRRAKEKQARERIVL